MKKKKKKKPKIRRTLDCYGKKVGKWESGKVTFSFPEDRDWLGKL